jgi:cephalosporin hydroxylase
MYKYYPDWCREKIFSTDWTSRHLGTWADIFQNLNNDRLKILEIGSWEGRSAIFFLNFFTNSHLYCIDTFLGSEEHFLKEKWSSQVGFIEDRFDKNLSEFAGRFEKIKDRSFNALAKMVTDGEKFDIVLIDGSHHSADVLSDAVLTWPMINVGGYMIFDDYDWNYEADEILKPRLGVDAFLATRTGSYEECSRGYQLIIRKTAA